MTTEDDDPNEANPHGGWGRYSCIIVAGICIALLGLKFVIDQRTFWVRKFAVNFLGLKILVWTFLGVDKKRTQGSHFYVKQSHQTLLGLVLAFWTFLVYNNLSPLAHPCQCYT